MIQRINAGKGHWYKIDGQKVDGVTTLIKDGVPKPALVSWAAKSVAEYVADNMTAVTGMAEMGRDQIVNALKGVPWSNARAAAAKGTEVHSLAEKAIHGQAVDVPEHLTGYVEGYLRFLDRHKVEPILVESVVGNRRWKYAGSLDMVARIDGDVAIADIKTSASGIYGETALQLAAYRYAEVYLDDGAEKPMHTHGIGCGYAIWCRADGTDLIPVECGEDVFRIFTHVAYVARKTALLKELIGEAAYA
jgi:hypothetical protein